MKVAPSSSAPLLPTAGCSYSFPAEHELFAVLMASVRDGHSASGEGGRQYPPGLPSALDCTALVPPLMLLHWYCPDDAQVRKVPPSDAKIFTEYILPCLSLLPTDAELSVQVCPAAGVTLASLAG